MNLENQPAPQPSLDQAAALDSIFPVTGPAQSASADEESDYRVSIPNFEGPLDLLLHLIRRDQVNIHDIPVSRICKSYLEHLEIMQQFDVNIAGEFMVMAATLTLLKSQILLPVEGEAEEEEDPRAPLVAQLLEYERFKIAAESLNNIPWLFRDIYPRPFVETKEIMPPTDPETAPVEPIDTYQMLLALKAATDRTTRPPFEVTQEADSLSDRVAVMSTMLTQRELISFAELVPDIQKRRELVVTFLAMLELARLKFVQILQAETFGPIEIRSIRSLGDLDMGLLDQF